MNGCLIRIIIIALIVIVISSIIVNQSDIGKEVFDKFKNISDILTKIIKYKE